ncbi:MAG: DUF47 family protein [Clostridia bacterium]|nr:DUF47 family protein [Clostridia bacterium]
MDEKIYYNIINHLELVEGCFLNLEKFISFSNSPEARAEKLEELCSEISLNEKKADFSLQSVSSKLKDSGCADDIDEFFNLCDSVANRCQDFAYAVCSVNLNRFRPLGAGLIKITSASRLLFSYLKEMTMHLKAGSREEALKLTDKIKNLETKLDVYEKESFKEIVSLDISQSEKMQYMMLINKISKIPDVIRIASECIIKTVQ